MVFACSPKGESDLVRREDVNATFEQGMVRDRARSLRYFVGLAKRAKYDADAVRVGEFYDIGLHLADSAKDYEARRINAAGKDGRKIGCRVPPARKS